jgi:hypothetical protein
MECRNLCEAAASPQSWLSFAEADVDTTTCLSGGAHELATADSGVTD